MSGPTRCDAGVLIPGLCNRNPGGPSSGQSDLSVKLVVSLSMDVVDFMATFQNAFIVGVAQWLGESVDVADVKITCVCEVSCELNGGVTPEGSTCGGGSENALRRLQQSLSDTSAGLEVECEVAVSIAQEQARVSEYVQSPESQGDLAEALVEGGLPERAAAGASASVSYDRMGTDAVVVPSRPANYASVLLTVMIAVPLAMLMVGLAVYQNNRKRKPVAVAPLVFSIILAFYDFACDLWFATMRTPDPRYQYFSWIAAGVILVCLLTGAAGMYYEVSRFSFAKGQGSCLDWVVVVAAITNLELVVLIPWDEDSFSGMPDFVVASLPTLTVLVEDLPQLLIQGSYLMVSGDTDNLFVLLSVALSACSLLMRFTRSLLTIGARPVDEDDDDDGDGDEEGQGPGRREGL